MLIDTSNFKYYELSEAEIRKVNTGIALIIREEMKLGRLKAEPRFLKLIFGKE